MTLPEITTILRWSASDLGEFLGVSRSWAHQLMRGDYKPAERFRAKIEILERAALILLECPPLTDPFWTHHPDLATKEI